MKVRYLSFSLILFASCTNLENVEPKNLTAFVQWYGGTGNYKASAILTTEDGYLIAGDSIGISETAIVLIKTNKLGQTQWRKLIKHGSVSSLLTTPTGFIICGDSVKIDLTELSIIDQVRTKLRLIAIDPDGQITADKSFGDININDETRKDFKGNAISILDNQKIIVTSSVSLPKTNPVVNSYTQVSAHSISNLSQNWVKNYNQDNDRNYRNSKSVLVNSLGNIIWVTSSFTGTSSNGVSFVRIPVLKPDDQPVNGDTFGFNDQTNYYGGNDIKKSNIGFGVIGTFQTSTGSNSNVFFLRTDPIGNIISSSPLFFDGPTTQPLNDQNQSVVQDQGLTLTATSDGGFLLAGSTTSTTDGNWGNGNKDVYLIRLDGAGNFLWSRFLGGSGDDIPAEVIQTEDGGFVLTGTSTLAGQSAIFMIKTNSQGVIKN